MRIEQAIKGRRIPMAVIYRKMYHNDVGGRTLLG